MSKNRRTTRIVIAAAIAAVAGLAGLGLSLVVAGSTGTAAQPATTSTSNEGSVPAEQPSAAPTPSTAPTNGTITQVGPTVTTTSEAKPAKVTQTVTNNSKQVVVTPGKPPKTSATKPTNSTPAAPSKECPGTRQANPSLWDACRAGYVAPTIEAVGVIACQAIDREKGNWKVILKYKMVGGNYRSAEWASLSNNASGTSQLIIRGVPASALTAQISVPFNASIYVGSMNGLPGYIDLVERVWDEDIALAGVCS